MWQDATKLKKILVLINLFGNNGFTHEKSQYVQSKKEHWTWGNAQIFKEP